MVKEVPISNGTVALVDDEDFAFVSGLRWHAVRRGATSYAQARIGGRRTYLHRLILNTTKDQIVDHANRNGLDNRKGNLRIATHSQNMANRAAASKNSLGLKGVQETQSGRYRAQIRANGRKHSLGVFDSPEAAARAYDVAARQHFGEFAHTNFSESPSTK